MKKITLLFFCLTFFSGFSQSKSTGVITLESNITANFTLNNATSKVTLILTGPLDRWFGLGLGVQSGFNMSDGDVLVYTTSLTDRNFVGKQEPAIDTQDWTLISDIPASGIRTLTLERALTNSDVNNDLQLPYDTTTSINLVGVRSASVNTGLSSNHVYGFNTASFNLLGVEDLSLNAVSIYPNPVSGDLFIQAKTNLSKVNLYSQTGSLIKSVNVLNNSNQARIDVNGVQSGVYLLELQNDSVKSWKKVIIN